MNEHPAVSIIVNVYNGEKYLRQTLESVYAQTYDDWEIIFWDNASTDRTPEIAKQFDDRLRYFRSQTTTTLGEARNLALREVRGRYVCFLDADDIWLPQKLKWQIPVLDEREDIGAIYADTATIDENGTIVSNHWGYFRSKDGDHIVEMLEGFYVHWLTVVFRKSVLDAIGGFRPYKISEDFDVLMRAALDYPFLGIDKVVSQYRIHDSNYSRDVTGLHREAIDILETLIEEAKVKPHHQLHIQKLKVNLADRHYHLGNRLCSEGNVLEGKIHLKKAWPDSTYRWKAVAFGILTSILGFKGFGFFINVKRRVFNK